MKLYHKRGKRNYKEQKMLKELEASINKKIEGDPNFSTDIVPATNQIELQAMYNKYVVEDVEFTETKTNDMAASKSETFEESENTDDTFDSIDDIDDSDGGGTIDPFNSQNPIVRDYVLGKDALGRERGQSDDMKTSFEEPTSFKEAFEIPTFDEEGIEEKAEEPKATKSKSEKNARPEPMNPSFDEMSGGKKKRSSKKFAKYIVEAVCTLSQKGFVWYANKDINEAKLAEYELNGEIDLSLLVSLQDGQQVTIKEFFASQCIAAEQLSSIDETQKSDMIDALTEVMLEKGIAPTPTQELIMITLTIFGGQAVTLMALKSQTNSLLNQLRGVNESNQDNNYYDNSETQPSEPSEAGKKIDEGKAEFDEIESVSDSYTETDLERVEETIE